MANNFAAVESYCLCFYERMCPAPLKGKCEKGETFKSNVRGRCRMNITYIRKCARID